MSNACRRWSAPLLALFVGLSCSDANKAPGAQAGDLVQIQGAGASFPAPLYLKWFKTFSAAQANVQVDYQSVGSGSGVKSFIDKTVDFGASDAAMTPEEVARVDVGAFLLPMTAGSIVLAFNLADVKALKLSRKAYAGIFLGEVKRWNDAAIAASNPGVHLPDLPINVVVRADSSGTSYVLTRHLSAISEAFARSPGPNKMPNWPVGTRSKGNEGVTAALKTTPGSIGYVEYGYAKSQGLAMATLENKAGTYIDANAASGQAALASATLPDDLVAWASDPDAPRAYPIVSYTWLLVYKRYHDKKKLAALVDLLTYGITTGQKEAEPLGYIPLPPAVVTKVQAAIQSIRADT